MLKQIIICIFRNIFELDIGHFNYLLIKILIIFMKVMTSLFTIYF